MDKIFPRQFLWVDDSNGSGDALVLIRDRHAENGNANIVGQVSANDGLRVVENHTGLVQQTPNDIDRVFRGSKLFISRQDSAIRVTDFHVVIAVNVDLFHITRE
ncbi:hypothetical protein D3C76_1305480 [compost metagenome]